jgi:hypothetical protein
MTNRSRIFVLMILAIAALLAGCTGTPFSTDNGPAADGVPKPLHRIEAAGEDIIDLALVGDWQKVDEKIAMITSAWDAYQPQAASAGVTTAHREALTSAFARMQTAVSARDAAATRQAANDLEAVVLDLFALYSPTMPVEIGRLDVVERQIILDVTANNFDAAAASLAKTRAAWESVKPSILAHNGKSVVDKFEASLALQDTRLQARDIAALMAEVNNGLEIVDELEKLY